MTIELQTPAIAWEGISFSFVTPDELSDLMFEGFIPEAIAIDTHVEEDGTLGAHIVAAVEESRFALLKFIRVNADDIGEVDFEDGILTLKDNRIELC